MKSAPQVLYVVDNESFYAIPKSVAEKYLIKTNKAVHREGNVSADDVFAEYDQLHGNPAAILRGVRARENLSQVEFAKRINVTQSALSKMESGARTIGKTIAKRIDAAFDVNYRYFLS